MQKVFDEVGTLDTKCYKKYGLSEDILMEHAATAMLDFITAKFKKQQKILIVCGIGNNGADGIALARLLQGQYKVKLFIPYYVKSKMAKLQLKRSKLVDVKLVDKISKCDVLVDCFFGSGLSRGLNKESCQIIEKLNQLKAYKIACDIPSGINSLGQIIKVALKVDTTITMGALKKSLYSDFSKEYVGNIIVANLGIQRELYENLSNTYLLEKKDIKLPIRKNKLSNKGTFGHLAVVVGDKKGAGLLACQTALSFGSGLVTAINNNKIKKVPNEIMYSDKLPKNTTAICIGMGLGCNYDETLLDNDLPKVIDADMFYDKNILNILKQKKLILTPHPKEFCALLKRCKIADISINELQNNRFKYVEIFSKRYPSVVLLLKGVNVLISQNKKIYINTLGTSALSKAGSGDILSGLIASLLSQGYTLLDATISGNLAHTLASLNYKGNNYSLTPKELISQIKKL